MLTDDLVRGVRLNIFQSMIYVSNAVESGVGECITRRREQESVRVMKLTRT